MIFRVQESKLRPILDLRRKVRERPALQGFRKFLSGRRFRRFKIKQIK